MLTKDGEEDGDMALAVSCERDEKEMGSDRSLGWRRRRARASGESKKKVRTAHQTSAKWIENALGGEGG